MTPAQLEHEVQELKEKIKSMKFRMDLLAEENHTLKIRIMQKESLIEDLSNEVGRLKKNITSVPFKGLVS